MVHWLYLMLLGWVALDALIVVALALVVWVGAARSRSRPSRSYRRRATLSARRQRA